LKELAASGEIMVCHSNQFEDGKKIERICCLLTAFTPLAKSGLRPKVSEIYARPVYPGQKNAPEQLSIRGKCLNKGLLRQHVKGDKRALAFANETIDLA